MQSMFTEYLQTAAEIKTHAKTAADKRKILKSLQVDMLNIMNDAGVDSYQTTQGKITIEGTCKIHTQ
ncbi:MAG: hypothetical protein CL902_00625 [Dehalococcoidia bacterium]|nr:hypothetical protein [Dehalococcoidia bacterium]|tara:strand:- start:549 stop:749 length:201 start_codon:yes stop_codon:yes gene_type:complete